MYDFVNDPSPSSLKIIIIQQLPYINTLTQN